MKIRMNTRTLAVSAAILIVTGSLWFGRPGTRGGSAHGAGAAIAAETKVDAVTRSVEVVKPKHMAMFRSLNVPATIEAYETADLYARVSGYVGDVRTDIGDKVKSGDVLCIIEVPEMADELRQAEAVLGAKEAKLLQARAMIETVHAERDRYSAEQTLKKITLERKKELRTANAIPDQELDQARGEFEVSEAQVKLGNARAAGVEADIRVAEAEVAMERAAVARLNTLMEYSTIRAPFDGVVSRRLVDRGALVQSANANQSSPMFTVQRTDQLRIFIEAPETDVPHIRVGISADVTPFGMKEKSFAGKVARIASSLNPATRTMRTEIDVPNSDGLLMHGMYAQVVLKLDERPSALTIPATAILTEGTQAFVFTVINDRAVRTNIQIGLDDGVRIEVVQGLSDESLVVLAGKGLVSDGAPVRPVAKDAGT